MSSFVNFWVDDIYTTAPRSFTLLQACSSVGVEVPRFCYHEKLSIAGNCRMCLVEVNNSKKLVASCAVPISENLKIYTNNLRVKKARESVLEFLLANHPLDCPICDQGGECDLQDITVSFGSDRGRFYEIEKRAVEDKYCGPLIKTVMTRCIHCTRCIRFISEIGGYPDFGTTGRGTRMEVGTYIANSLTNELSSNIVDLCPVGALTSKPYSFTSRPWELNNVESIDVFDVLCGNIRLSVYGNKVKRVLPRINEDLNEDWLSNKTRYIYDSFDIQRLNSPLLNLGFLYLKNHNLWVSSSWKQVLLIFANFLNKVKVGFVMGPHLDLETVFSLKQSFFSMGLLVPKLYFNDYSFSYFSSIRIKEIESFSTFLSINSLLRNEAPLINTRVRKSFNYFMSSFKFIGVGVGSDYFTYPIQTLSNNARSLSYFLNGKSYFCKSLLSSENKCVVFCDSLTSMFFNRTFLNLFKPVFVKVLQSTTNFSTAHAGLFNLMLNKFIYSIGINTNINYTPLIYQGQHGASSAKSSAIVLPTTVFAEKTSNYLNIEGLIQKAYSAISSDRLVKKDWEVLRALSDFNKILNLDLFHVRSKEYFFRLNDQNLIPVWAFNTEYFANLTTVRFNIFKNSLFSNKILNYYWSDLISQNSKLMAKCASTLINYNISYK